MKLPDSIKETLRHPLLLTIVGFLLTGIIGAGFTWWLNSLSSARDTERLRRERVATSEEATREHAVEAVREITDLINERRTRAMLVASAIYRQAEKSEVEQRKMAYDEVYVRWNTKAQSVALRIREIFKQAAPEYESYFDALTHNTLLGSRSEPLKSSDEKEGLLTIIDQCITGAFDAYRLDTFSDASSAKAILERCPPKHQLSVDELNFQLINCSNVLGDSLFFVVNTLDLSNSKERIHEDSERIKAACIPGHAAS
jgi:hypothetical protein